MKKYKLVPITEENIKVENFVFDIDPNGEYEIIYEVVSVKECEMFGLQFVLHDFKSGFRLENLKTTFGRNLRLKVAIEPIPFSLDLFQTDKYDVINELGEDVEVFVSKARLKYNKKYPLIVIGKGGYCCVYTKMGRFGDYLRLFLIERD